MWVARGTGTATRAPGATSRASTTPTPSERYATQPEILRYANHVADRFDLRRDIQFETRVERATFDEETSRWSITTDRG